jgi:S-(hydroxymethyl)glutathione dehydrogenase / alcohol dehydrogenase
MRIRAAVLREYRTPLEVCELELDPPGPGEVLVRVAATGVCHSDLHLADGHIGPGRHPMVLGHEGGGIVELVGEGVAHVAPGDPVSFCLVPSCGTCSACAAGRRNLCKPAAAAAWAGTLLDRTSRLSFPDGSPVKHFNSISCFAERCVVPAASAVPVPAALPLWQAALLGCGVVTAVGAVRNAARVAAGETVCIVGCGGVGLQLVAAARLAGAGRVISLERHPAKRELALARGATDAVAADDDPVAAVRAIAPDGVDHAFEAVGSAATIRMAWDVLRPGATATVVGIAPAGVDVSLPAFELLFEKGIRGSYYGSGDAATVMTSMAEDIVAGRFPLADVVSHVTDLDGIEAAFARLRAGEGARTIAVIDAALAGDPEPYRGGISA